MIFTYLLFLLISLRASLPSLRVLITNQDRKIIIKKPNNTNDVNIGLINTSLIVKGKYKEEILKYKN